MPITEIELERMEDAIVQAALAFYWATQENNGDHEAPVLLRKKLIEACRTYDDVGKDGLQRKSVFPTLNIPDHAGN